MEKTNGHLVSLVSACCVSFSTSSNHARPCRLEERKMHLDLLNSANMMTQALRLIDDLLHNPPHIRQISPPAMSIEHQLALVPWCTALLQGCALAEAIRSIRCTGLLTLASNFVYTLVEALSPMINVNDGVVRRRSSIQVFIDLHERSLDVTALGIGGRLNLQKVPYRLLPVTTPINHHHRQHQRRCAPP